MAAGQGEHDMNAVLRGAFMDDKDALRVVVVDPASGVFQPKDENGVWSDAVVEDSNGKRFVRIVYV